MFDRSKVFVKEVRLELSKVVWPTQEKLKAYTLVVIASCIVLALAVGAWDFLLGNIMEQVFLNLG